MINKCQQSRLLSIAFWLIVISWMMVPLAALMSHVSYYYGNGIIAMLSLCAAILSGVGIALKSTRTGWFLLSLILALLTLLYGVTDIKFPVPS